MAAFCTVADLAALLHVAIPAGDDSAEAAIVTASALIQNYTGQRIEYVADDVLPLTVEAHRSVILLPQQPVTAVASVVEDGVTLTVGDGYRWTAAGLLVRQSRVWRSGWQDVIITYSHGYQVIPGDLAAICAQMAARLYRVGLTSAATSGIAGIQAEQLPDYSVTYAGGVPGASMTAPPILMPSEARALDRYRVSV